MSNAFLGGFELLNVSVFSFSFSQRAEGQSADFWPEVLPVDMGENARHNTSESWASIFTSSSRKSRLKILNTHTDAHTRTSAGDDVMVMIINISLLIVKTWGSYCRFPQRSPAARCCPSGLIPSTLIPAFPSAPAISPLSPSACRCCVFSPTYKILSRSWYTQGMTKNCNMHKKIHVCC